jgi:hypothetical protein
MSVRLEGTGCVDGPPDAGMGFGDPGLDRVGQPGGREFHRIGGRRIRIERRKRHVEHRERAQHGAPITIEGGHSSP